MSKTPTQKQWFSFGAFSIALIVGLALGAGIAQSVPVRTTVLAETPIALFFLYHVGRFIKYTVSK